ncbi:MAG: UDP-N-acetylglucosamine 2-epimerase, partial [Bacteroidota bacterium]
AIKELNIPTFWFWPNVDAGSDGTSKGIRSFRERYTLEHVHFFKNMEGGDFLRLLCNADCLIGNSSVGIRECAFLGVPVVNIGSRQSGRQRGPNVLDVDYQQTEIIAAVKDQIKHGKHPSAATYGGGDAGAKIAEELVHMPLTFAKRITY